MTRRRTTAMTMIAVAFQAALCGTRTSARADTIRADRDIPPASDTLVRMARSEDGLSFTDAGMVFARHAAAPDLALMPNGDLFAIFDCASPGESGGPIALVVSQSKDGGRSWSTARPIRLRGIDPRKLQARHADLVPLPNGRLRLYFTTTFEKRGGESGSLTIIRSAVTRNGLDYQLDGRTRVRPTRAADIHPVAVWANGGLHLYVDASADRSSRADDDVSIMRHFVSRDGRRFANLRLARAQDVAFVGSAISVGGGLCAHFLVFAGGHDRGNGELCRVDISRLPDRRPL